MWGASTSNVKKWLHMGSQDEPAKPEATAYVPDQPVPSDAPLPPRRAAALGEGKVQHAALKTPGPPQKPAEAPADAPDTTGSIPASPATAPAPAPAK
jgi:hypothetical protein